MTTAIFLTAASPQSGGGHVLRCLALAESLERHGLRPAFAVDSLTLETVGLLRDSRFQIIETAPHDLHIAEIGQEAGAMIFDAYGFDSFLERRWRHQRTVRIVIDDLANRRHDCEMLVDHAPGRLAEHYAGLVPADCEILAGPSFALLRSDFRHLRHRALERRSGAPLRRVLVALGLTDVGGITRRVVEGVLLAGQGLAVDVVVGRGAASLDWLTGAATGASVKVHVDVDGAQMAALMVEADIAVGGGGGASLERCCMALPSLVILLAENQRLIAESLERAGAVTILGDIGSVTAETVAVALTSCARDADLRKRATIAASIVDGDGADRVSAAILRRLGQG